MTGTDNTLICGKCDSRMIVRDEFMTDEGHVTSLMCLKCGQTGRYGWKKKGEAEVMKEIIKETIGQRLKRLRKEREMTQAELEVAADLGWSYVSKIEKGKFKPPDETVGKLAKIFGVSAAYLKCETDDPSSATTTASEQGPDPMQFAPVEEEDPAQAALDAEINQGPNAAEERMIKRLAKEEEKELDIIAEKPPKYPIVDELEGEGKETLQEEGITHEFGDNQGRKVRISFHDGELSNVIFSLNGAWNEIPGLSNWQFLGQVARKIEELCG